ncbi:phosphatase domain-containing protein [Pontivivens insulae]|uniref:Phosphatidate phosphatase APP1 catalytic domain-containing protein n=1 Tax=Pontivivens insulae TaxID=1639689 RepID=A0A2R8A7U8_9RHOB|nr:phosphatase domain-containing protein [Pontivivens insulae]RED18419.1 phosphatidate phosphatase APP1 [Pontivivens insulae]SPF28317.1 hypothetical protein POI8812_00615 [Pontivivens insulae]
MPLIRILHRLAVQAERAVDRFRPKDQRPPLVEPYRGHATPDGLVLRGRVLAGLRRDTPHKARNKWANFKAMVGLFFTDEIADIEVLHVASGATALSDEEGYITLQLPRPSNAQPGWRMEPIQIAGDDSTTVQVPVLIPDPAAEFGVISDIDDTVLRTGAWNTARNLWTSLTGNALTREVFADGVALMEKLHEGKNPVFYVSSSPWNLHDFLDNILFRKAGLVAGPVFLRDLGISETQFIKGTHGDHKGAAIDTILAANPELSFVLIGDTGQHDAEVYAAAHARHPGRIRRIILRGTVETRDIKAEAGLLKLEKSGLQVDVVPDYNSLVQ